MADPQVFVIVHWNIRINKYKFKLEYIKMIIVQLFV